MGIHKVVGRVNACFEQSFAIHGNGDAEYREEIVDDGYFTLDVIFVVETIAFVTDLSNGTL